jgi:hypothetical protein
MQPIMDLADASDPPAAIYLEASPAGKPLYEKLGFVQVEGRGNEMVRRKTA